MTNERITKLISDLLKDAEKARNEALKAGAPEGLIAGITNQLQQMVNELVAAIIKVQDYSQLLRDLAHNPKDPEETIKAHERQRTLKLFQDAITLADGIDDPQQLQKLAQLLSRHH